ncbi:MAG: aldo/keto reductase, partial [Lentisphaerae bacterium]|nr:aldo/keto reductase [Lentisphaerota bacterium]
ILPFCRERNIGVICYSPMYKGLLTGKFSTERAVALPESDHRRRDPQFQPPLLERNLALVEELTPLAAAAGHTMAELAIAWTLNHPAVTAAIVGVRHPRQTDVLRAGEWELDEATATAVDQVLDHGLT